MNVSALPKVIVENQLSTPIKMSRSPSPTTKKPGSPNLNSVSQASISGLSSTSGKNSPTSSTTWEDELPVLSKRDEGKFC